MRVVSGRLGGRIFASPPGKRTHPMSEKVRGSLFNILGDIKGLSLLDAFSGSGALAIEAVSRGAKQVIALDIDKRAYTTILKNITDLDLLQSIRAIHMSASVWSTNNPKQQFDIVMCDPPYDDVQWLTLRHLGKHVAPGGHIICSLPPDVIPEFDDDLQFVMTKSYGDAVLWFYGKPV